MICAFSSIQIPALKSAAPHTVCAHSSSLFASIQTPLFSPGVPQTHPWPFVRSGAVENVFAFPEFLPKWLFFVLLCHETEEVGGWSGTNKFDSLKALRGSGLLGVISVLCIFPDYERKAEGSHFLRFRSNSQHSSATEVSFAAA